MSLEETTANTNKTSRDISGEPRKSEVIIIGIAGGTGSGKTTIARKLKESFQDKQVQILAQDSYYKDQSDMPFEERLKTNYDHPDAYDNDLLIDHIKKLMNGQAVDQPVYSFTDRTRSKETKRVEPADVLIIEGILALHDERLRKLMKAKIYVQTDPDIRLIRRINRDMRERGRSYNEIIEQYRSSVRPMHLLYTKPTKSYADIIIPEGGSNAVAISMVRAWLDQVLRKNRMNVAPVGEQINPLEQED